MQATYVQYVFTQPHYLSVPQSMEDYIITVTLMFLHSSLPNGSEQETSYIKYSFITYLIINLFFIYLNTKALR